MQVSESGEIESFAFHKAIIRSHAKLAYAADRYRGNSDDLITTSTRWRRWFRYIERCGSGARITSW